MAEFLWTFAVQEVLKKVLKVATEEIGVAWGFKKQLSKLTKWLLKSEAILRDINTKKLYNESVRMWVDDLQLFVYQADDLLDELVYEDLRRRVETDKTKKKVHNFFSYSHNPFLFRRQMAKRMKDITETLYKHYCEASPLGLVALVGQESTGTHKNIDLIKQIRETTSNLNFGEVIIGREVEVSNIMKLVIDSSNEHPMSVILIVGMGGLGKTTLAKMVFNHDSVKAHFDKTIWVCVSEPFIVINILEGIFQSLTKTSTSSGLNKENLFQRLQEEMQDKNYFLVLDDVWNEEPRLWVELRECLKNIAGKSGNSIIVTTRSAEVATVMGTTSSHHLKKLSDDQCWSLFKEGANADGLELEDIREEVVAKIGGIPLVAKVLGGAIKFEGNYERWVKKFKSVMKNISKDDKDFVSSILKLSVDCLPLLSLKQCFAYCSNFPKDYIFHKESLIQMWIAQGFIQLQEGDNELTMEDIGEGYFNFMVSRSLFEVFNKHRSEIITHFKMHDLIHDIACVISSHQRVESNLSNSGEKSMGKLHTLICFDKKIDDKFDQDYVCLRVLVVNTINFELFTSFGMFKHLRYLAIGDELNVNLGVGDEMKATRESITMLYNLQTLKLGIGIPLPKNLRKLVKLRHLRFYDIEDAKMPLHISQLIHLQTLTEFRVGYEEGCKIKELGPLKNLKGRLVLSNLEKVKSKVEAMGVRLMEKKNLTCLVFDWNLSSEDEDIKENELEVLEGLQPHHDLQSLSIHKYSGQAFPNRIFVEGLVTIFLGECKKCEILPMLGQLPNLEELVIFKMNSVRSIGKELYGHYNSNQMVSFPKLKIFSLSLLKNLENWDDISNGNSFPLLKILSLEDCSKLKSVPDNFKSLRRLSICYCENLMKLPNQLECCDSIKSMMIRSCPNLPLNKCNGYNLEDLKICGCMNDYDFNALIHQSSITHLSLEDTSGNTHATQLPQQLGHLTTLKILEISCFNGVEALPDWLGNLTSLEQLKLSYCKNLKWLPSKQAMLSLTKLNSLEVFGCPLLPLGQGDPEQAKLSHLQNNCVKVY